MKQGKLFNGYQFNGKELKLVSGLELGLGGPKGQALNY